MRLSPFSRSQPAYQQGYWSNSLYINSAKVLAMNLSKIYWIIIGFTYYFRDYYKRLNFMLSRSELCILEIFKYNTTVFCFRIRISLMVLLGSRVYAIWLYRIALQRTSFKFQFHYGSGVYVWCVDLFHC